MQCIGCDIKLVEMTKKNWSPRCIWENQLKMVVLTNKINHFINWSKQPKIFGYINQLLLVEMTN